MRIFVIAAGLLAATPALAIDYDTCVRDSAKLFIDAGVPLADVAYLAPANCAKLKAISVKASPVPVGDPWVACVMSHARASKARGIPYELAWHAAGKACFNVGPKNVSPEQNEASSDETYYGVRKLYGITD